MYPDVLIVLRLIRYKAFSVGSGMAARRRYDLYLQDRFRRSRRAGSPECDDARRSVVIESKLCPIHVRLHTPGRPDIDICGF